MQKKTAIITGGGSGFGREVALQLARKGTNIAEESSYIHGAVISIDGGASAI